MDTQRYTIQNKQANILLLENETIHVYALGGRVNWSVGRYAPNMPNVPDIMFSSGIVSREHGWIRNVEGRWYFVDNPKNLNGTFHNGRKIPRSDAGVMQSVPLENGDILRIDSEDLNHADEKGVLMLFTEMSVAHEWTAFSLRNRRQTVIGRHEDCDIVEPVPYISAKHAVISNISGCFFLEDCASTAGTFLNGQKVSGKAILREKDVITLCDRTYFFLEDKLLYAKRDQEKELKDLVQKQPSDRPVILKADIATKRVKNNNGNGLKELIRDIHLEIRQGTLVALLGTAGAGKSTVMNCLNGMDLEGVEGSVIYRDVDLMKNFEQMKYLIGSVPQEKTFHSEFTPEKEFRIAAKKRLPPDTTRREIDERVTKTLEILGISGVRKNKNSKLSGGEKTRVNIGIELVANRDLLCLDEPDQGLDPKYKHEVFQIMQDLAHENGKSVISIIHDVSEIDMFDQVIMLVKADGVGRLAFSGSPAEMRRRFGVEDIRNVYGILEKDPGKYIM